MKIMLIFADKLDFVPIISDSPTDFNGRHSGWSFTPQLSAALHYAKYYKRLYPKEKIVVICLRIPNHLLEGDNQPYTLQYPSDMFKKVIWLSRRRGRRTSDMMDVNFMNAKLIIGHTSRGSETPFNQMQSWNEISDANLVYIQDGGLKKPMTQYYFEDEFESILEEALKQENLTIHDADNPEYEVDVSI